MLGASPRPAGGDLERPGVTALSRAHVGSVSPVVGQESFEPGFVPAQHIVGLALLAAGRYEEAIAEMRDFRQRAGRIVPLAAADLSRAYVRAGHRDKALKELRHMEELAKREYVPARSFGLLYVDLGKMIEPFRWTNKAVDDRESLLAMLKTSPTFDVLRDDARFDKLLRRVGLEP